MLEFSKFFLPIFFFFTLICFFHHRTPAQATITSKFQGVISQVFSQPDPLWPRRQSDLQSYHEQTLSLQKKIKKWNTSCHSPLRRNGSSFPVCRFKKQVSKLQICLTHKAALLSSDTWSNAIAKSGWVHKDWSPRQFQTDTWCDP